MKSSLILNIFLNERKEVNLLYTKGKGKNGPNHLSLYFFISDFIVEIVDVFLFGWLTTFKLRK